MMPAPIIRPMALPTKNLPICSPPLLLFQHETAGNQYLSGLPGHRLHHKVPNQRTSMAKLLHQTQADLQGGDAPGFRVQEHVRHPAQAQAGGILDAGQRKSGILGRFFPAGPRASTETPPITKIWSFSSHFAPPIPLRMTIPRRLFPLGVKMDCSTRPSIRPPQTTGNPVTLPKRTMAPPPYL